MSDTAPASCPASAATPDLSSTVSPHYAADTSVSQTGSGIALTGLLGLSMLCAAPGMWLAVQFDAEATGWRAAYAALGMFSGMALTMVGMVGGMVLWFVLEHWYLRLRGRVPFSETTAFRLDAQGLSVAGLGACAWQDVLSYEGVPDSDSTLIIHTRPYGGLLVCAATDALLPVLDHYLHATRESALREAQAGGADAVLRFKGLVFHWPRFLAWIIAGYGLAGGIGIALLYNAGDAGFLKTVVGLVILLPLSAWLLWTIPFWQLSLFGARRTRAFELAGQSLRSLDDAWRFDLRDPRETRARFRSKSGIGYALEFVTLQPKQGRRLDLILEAPERQALQDALRSLGVPE